MKITFEMDDIKGSFTGDGDTWTLDCKDSFEETKDHKTGLTSKDVACILFSMHDEPVENSEDIYTFAQNALKGVSTQLIP